MAYDEKLAARVTIAVGQDARVETRRMFGGLCFLINGNMAFGVEGKRLVVRVGPEAHAAALKLKGARPMDFTGKPLKGFVYVSAEAVRTAVGLRKWLKKGFEFAGKLKSKR